MNYLNRLYLPEQKSGTAWYFHAVAKLKKIVLKIGFIEEMQTT